MLNLSSRYQRVPLGFHRAPREQSVWGVVGGMGPLASAEFLKTIYEECSALKEQDAPVVILLSDPTFPDRTSALEKHNEQVLTKRLTSSIRCLLDMEVTDVVICCVTLHAVLDYIPRNLRGTVVSLIDLIMSAVTAGDERHLLVCTNGTRSSRIFENHRRWMCVSKKVILPDSQDQLAIHKLIYRIKRNEVCPSILTILHDIMGKYGVSSFIAGCTEMHVVNRRFHDAAPSLCCIDPLQIIARHIAKCSVLEIAS
jgi:aspartate racemase